MRRSKLDIHVDILKVLAHHGPLRLTHIMRKANVCYTVLKRYLDLLTKQNLVVQKTLGEKEVVYAITQRGFTVLKCFKELDITLLKTEETRKIRALLY